MPSLFRKQLTNNKIQMKARFHLLSNANAWKKMINGSGKDNVLQLV